MSGKKRSPVSSMQLPLKISNSYLFFLFRTKHFSQQTVSSMKCSSFDFNWKFCGWVWMRISSTGNIATWINSPVRRCIRKDLWSCANESRAEVRLNIEASVKNYIHKALSGVSLVEGMLKVSAFSQPFWCAFPRPVLAVSLPLSQ
jgi:hypothetical protein